MICKYCGADVAGGSIADGLCVTCRPMTRTVAIPTPDDGASVPRDADVSDEFVAVGKLLGCTHADDLRGAVVDVIDARDAYKRDKMQLIDERAEVERQRDEAIREREQALAKASLTVQRINNLERGQETLLRHIAALLEVTDRMGDTLNLMEALDDEATEFANVRTGAAREVLLQARGFTPLPAARNEDETDGESQHALSNAIAAYDQATGKATP